VLGELSPADVRVILADVRPPQLLGLRLLLRTLDLARTPVGAALSDGT
jgi:hypothetical protein